MIVSPPMLRSESYSVSDKQQDFVLVYLMNEDMLPQLISQAKKYPDIKLQVRHVKHNIPTPPNQTNELKLKSLLPNKL